MSATRVICQRSNVSWDVNLRQRYIALVKGSAAVVALALILFAALNDLSIRTIFTSILAPLLPLLGFVCSEVVNDQAAIAISNNIHDSLERLWSAILSGTTNANELDVRIRQVQDRIYENRRTSPVIPEKLYKALRPSQESVMFASAEEMADEFLQVQGRT